MNLHLTRFAHTITFGTFGKLVDIDAGKLLGYTVEQPWRPASDFPFGVPFHSCIPTGGYVLEPFESNKWGSTYVIVNPEHGVYAKHQDRADERGRYACLIHRGNFASNFQGCIGIGDDITAIDSTWAISNTSKTVEKVLDKLKAVGGTHTLIITDGVE